MKEVKYSHLLLQILSGLVSIVLWFAITYTEDPLINQHLTDISVKFIGEDVLEENGLIVVNKDSLPPLSAMIQGNRSKIISSIGDISAQIDVSNIKSAGDAEVTIKYNYPSSINFVKSNIQSVIITTEKIITRSIPVQIETVNQDKNTNFLIKPTCQISSITIRGAQTSVYRIAYAKASIDVTDMTKSNSQKYSYNFYNEKNTQVTDDNIIYTNHDSLPVHNIAYKRISLPITIILPDDMKEEYTLSVKTVSPSSIDVGLSDETEHISELTAIFDSSKKGDNSDYTLDINVPEGVYLPEKDRTVKAVCELVPKVLVDTEVTIETKNAPEGKTVTLNPLKIKVSAKCADDDITASKIHAVVDLSGVSDGETILPVSVTSEENIQIVGSYSTTVTIK